MGTGGLNGSLRQNLVKLRPCSEQRWEQPASPEGAFCCPAGCSSPGHTLFTLGQAAWAGMDLHWSPPRGRCSFTTLAVESFGLHYSPVAFPVPHPKPFSLLQKAHRISNPNCSFSNLLDSIKLPPPELCYGCSDGFNLSHSHTLSLPVIAYMYCARAN